MIKFGSVQLSLIPPDDYARVVLPDSAAMWAAGRTHDQYIGDFHELAASSYGKRRFRTLGVVIDGRIVASCKRYERELRCGDRTYTAVGIGAVFTPPDLRGRGYATAMLGAFLDSERARGTDLVFLFSDIHPAFYERLGFAALPSRTFSLRADSLPARRLDIRPVGDADWSGVRRCFDALDARRRVALRRTPLVWEWLRIAARSHVASGARVEFHVRTGKTTLAYVFGRRLPKTDTFVLDEFAYTGDEGFDAIPPLLRAAAGDLRKITGWLPPDLARVALPRGAVKRRKSAIAMLVPLSTTARLAWRTEAAAILADDADRCWPTDHI